MGHHLAQFRGFQKFLGTPIQTGKYWLDVDFPEGPPPEYERGGYVPLLHCYHTKRSNNYED